MSQLDTLLISAIVALVAAVTFLYFDAKKDRKVHAKATAEKDKVFSDAIEAAVTAHQKQEDDAQQRHEKSTSELVNDHRKEMSGMVDRAIEAFKNDKDHDRSERARILDLAEALERRAQSSRGGREGR
jgi:gas vesicle protein